MNRSVLLDIIRIAAAGWVVLWHWSGHGGEFARGYYTFDISWWPTWLDGPSNTGYVGVEVFFVLSGAVITHTAMGRPWTDFVSARFSRLFPVFFLTSLLAVPFFVFSFHQPFSWQAITGLNLWIGGLPLVGSAWSLGIEVQFYAMIALLLIALKTKPLTRHGTLRATQTWLLLIIVSRAAGWQPLQFLVLADWAPYFALGAVLSVTRTPRELLGNSATVAIAFLLSVHQLALRFESVSPGMHHKALLALAIISVVSLLVYGSHFESPTRPSRWRTSLTTLSLMTYPVYLLHETIGLGLVGIMTGRGLSVQVGYLLAGLSVLLISWLSVKYYEPVCRKIFSRIWPKQLATSQTQPSALRR